LFPLLLLAVTILGFVLHDDPATQQQVLSSALRYFPVIGDQIRDNVHSLDGSVVALAAGSAVALYGARGAPTPHSTLSIRCGRSPERFARACREATRVSFS